MQISFKKHLFLLLLLPYGKPLPLRPESVPKNVEHEKGIPVVHTVERGVTDRGVKPTATTTTSTTTTTTEATTTTIAATSGQHFLNGSTFMEEQIVSLTTPVTNKTYINGSALQVWNLATATTNRTASNMAADAADAAADAEVNVVGSGSMLVALFFVNGTQGSRETGTIKIAAANVNITAENVSDGTTLLEAWNISTNFNNYTGSTIPEYFMFFFSPQPDDEKDNSGSGSHSDSNTTNIASSYNESKSNINASGDSIWIFFMANETSAGLCNASFGINATVQVNVSESQIALGRNETLLKDQTVNITRSFNQTVVLVMALQHLWSNANDKATATTKVGMPAVDVADRVNVTDRAGISGITNVSIVNSGITNSSKRIGIAQNYGAECGCDVDCGSTGVCRGGRCCNVKGQTKGCATCDQDGDCKRCHDGFFLHHFTCYDATV